MCIEIDRSMRKINQQIKKDKSNYLNYKNDKSRCTTYVNNVKVRCAVDVCFAIFVVSYSTGFIRRILRSHFCIFFIKKA